MSSVMYFFIPISAFSFVVKPAVSVTAVTVASTPMMKEDKVKLTKFSLKLWVELKNPNTSYDFLECSLEVHWNRTKMHVN